MQIDALVDEAIGSVQGGQAPGTRNDTPWKVATPLRKTTWPRRSDSTVRGSSSASCFGFSLRALADVVDRVLGLFALEAAAGDPEAQIHADLLDELRRTGRPKEMAVEFHTAAERRGFLRDKQAEDIFDTALRHGEGERHRLAVLTLTAAGSGPCAMMVVRRKWASTGSTRVSPFVPFTMARKVAVRPTVLPLFST